MIATSSALYDFLRLPEIITDEATLAFWKANVETSSCIIDGYIETMSAREFDFLWNNGCTRFAGYHRCYAVNAVYIIKSASSSPYIWNDYENERYSDASLLEVISGFVSIGIDSVARYFHKYIEERRFIIITINRLTISNTISPSFVSKAVQQWLIDKFNIPYKELYP